MKKFVTSCVAASLLLSGCATIVGSDTQTLQVNSNPDGAGYTVKDETGAIIEKGITPSNITLAKSSGKYFGKKTYDITFSKKGYADATYPLKTSPNGWYIGGNILLGGLVGWLIVDPLNGGMYTISPDKVDIQLDK